MDSRSLNWNIISWAISALFYTIGILNLILVHPLYGLFYSLLATFYLPPARAWLEKKLGFPIPIFLQVLLAILVMWMTLGVGDLMEIYEASLRN